MTSPVNFRWDGEHMVPLERHRKLCDRQYVIGEIYLLVAEEERSMRSHQHYFASLREAWLNLPENLAERFPTVEHLRKWCLIKCGYSKENKIVCDSPKVAANVAGFISVNVAYSVTVVEGNVVTVYTPQSQAVRAMGSKVFQQSKSDVLDLLSSMVGVSRSELDKHAGKVA
jgi:hypothetical protein